MRTTLHHQDGPIRSAVSDHDDFCVLSFQQGGDIVHIHLPKRMEAASHMIVEAFNAHMNPEPRVIAVQVGDDPADEPLQSYVMLTDGTELFGKDADAVGFPSGGALSAEGALGILLAHGLAEGDPDAFEKASALTPSQVMDRLAVRMGREGDGDHAISPDDIPNLRSWVSNMEELGDTEAANSVERRDLP